MNWRIYATFYAHKARVSIDCEGNDTLWQLVMALALSGDVLHIEVTALDAYADPEMPEPKARAYRPNQRSKVEVEVS